MQTLQKILPKYTVALGIIFVATVVYLVTRGDTVVVEGYAVQKMALEQAIYATGYVDAGKMADMRSEISGTVRFVGASEGEQVAKGDTILVIGDRILLLAVDEAEAALAEQQAAKVDLEARLARSRALYKAGAIPLQELDDARREFIQAKKLFEQKNAQLQSRRDEAEKQLLRAPLTGTLTMQEARVGDDIVSGTLLATIVNPESYMIKVEVDELDIPRLKKGQKAVVALDAMPEKRFRASVSRIVPRTDRITKTSKIYLDLDEPIESMQEGMTAIANIVYNVRKGALLVPKSAVFKEGREMFVWKIEKSKLVKRNVTTGADDNRFIEILDGLVEADSVVTRPEEHFRDGMKARVNGEKTVNGDQL